MHGQKSVPCVSPAAGSGWRPYSGARRARGGDARAAAGFKAPLPSAAAALLPAPCLFLCVCRLRGGARCSTCPASREKFGPGALQAHLELRCEPKPPALTFLLLQESAGIENFNPCFLQRFEFCTVSQPPLSPSPFPAGRGGHPLPCLGTDPRGLLETPQRVWGKEEEPAPRFSLLLAVVSWLQACRGTKMGKIRLPELCSPPRTLLPGGG